MFGTEALKAGLDIELLRHMAFLSKVHHVMRKWNDALERDKPPRFTPDDEDILKFLQALDLT